MSTESNPKTALAPFEKAKAFLDRPDFKQQIARALPHHLTADRMLRVALTAVTRTPKLAECDLASIAHALLTASQLGLEVDGRNGHLVPYNNKGKMTCQFIPGYQGLIQLSYNHGPLKFAYAVCQLEGGGKTFVASPQTKSKP